MVVVVVVVVEGWANTARVSESSLQIVVPTVHHRSRRLGRRSRRSSVHACNGMCEPCVRVESDNGLVKELLAVVSERADSICCPGRVEGEVRDLVLHDTPQPFVDAEQPCHHLIG
jgi:hypothetical protein